MPARIDHPAVREQVRLLYLGNGRNLTLAAKTAGIPIDRAEKWKERGLWDKADDPAAKQLAVSEAVGKITKHAGDVLAKQKEKSRFNLAKFVVNGSKIAARSRSPLADAGKVKDLASVMEKVWPEEKSEAGINLNVLSISGEMAVQINQGSR